MVKKTKEKEVVKLTEKQKDLIEDYRRWYFDKATSTELADRSRAEKAVKELCRRGDVGIDKIIWVNSLEEGMKICNQADSVELLNSLTESLRISLPDSLPDSLRNSMWDSLPDSLWDAGWGSLWAAGWDSLPDSLLGSLRDVGWVALFTYYRDILGVVYDAESNKKLDLCDEVLASCFAVWVVRETATVTTAVLCERPAEVKIEDGKLVDLTWRTTPPGASIDVGSDWVAEQIDRECTELAAMLKAKNQAYGNSVLDPIRIFSQADAVEQLRVRIDDKLSRLKRGRAAGEDVTLDLLGYLMLLRIATKQAERRI